MIGIYKITNLKNGKIYIGQSKDINKRWNQHKANAVKVGNKLYYKPLYVDLRRNPQDFKWEVIEKFDTYNKATLDAAEEYWINYYNSAIDGYNINATAKISGQKICLIDTITNTTYYCMTIRQVEDILGSLGLPCHNVGGAATRAIKQNKLLYNRFKIFYTTISTE